MIWAVFAAGTPAPEVLDEEVILEGRFGIVLTRLDGPTLLQLSRSGAMSPGQTGAILAGLSSRATAWTALCGTLAAFPEHIATGIVTLIERLAPGMGCAMAISTRQRDQMTADGPRLIDQGRCDPCTRRARPCILSCHQLSRTTSPRSWRRRLSRTVRHSRLGAAGSRPGLRERLIQLVEATPRLRGRSPGTSERKDGRWNGGHTDRWTCADLARHSRFLVRRVETTFTVCLPRVTEVPATSGNRTK
jgi:hypothetical protein